MGAVQKLATVVIVGLVALATLIVLYLADEPNRREAKATHHMEASIERGIHTYVQFCLICHGPAGEGWAFEEPGRVGAPLGGQSQATWINQTEDPLDREDRAELLWNAIANGRGLMPAFGDELNDEQINELVLMIQNVNWNRVYNEAVEAAGGYPTPPPVDEEVDNDVDEPEPVEPGEATTSPVIEGFDIGWRYEGMDTDVEPVIVTIPAGEDVTLQLVNTGVTFHDFVVEELGIDVGMPVGETVEETVNLEPGQYEFICSVPGHAAAGMVGTLVVE